MIRVLTAAAKRFAWTPAATPSKRGFGVACGIDAGTYVALIAEVDVDEKTGRVQAKRVVCGQDMGVVVNPKGAVQQIEGCIIMGLGYALSEELCYEEGRLTTPSFSEYLIPTAMDVPRYQSIILESRSGLGPFGAKGVGEPAITAVAPAIANAVADAIGVRVFDLPITPEKVVKAIIEKGAAPT